MKGIVTYSYQTKMTWNIQPSEHSNYNNGILLLYDYYN